MNELQLFDFKGQQVRTMLIDNEPYFVGKDVAEVLGYKDTVNALKTHVDEEDKLGWQITTSGQKRLVNIINESGLYSLILSSKLPRAKEFKRWVTKEVLPAIRKTGSYDKRLSQFANMNLTDQLLMIATEQQKEVQAQNKRITVLEETIESKMYLTPGESRALGKKVNQRVHQLMREDGTNRYYKELSPYYFRSISTQLKNYFGVSNRNMILSKDFEEAMNFIEFTTLTDDVRFEVNKKYNEISREEYLFSQIGKMRR